MALSGLFWYLSEDAYTRYTNSTVSSKITEERNNVELYDKFKWASAGSALAAAGVTVFFYYVDTSTETIDKELNLLESPLDSGTN